MNQGNNVVQNINQNSVSNNVAQQIVQQSNNNSANVGDGLPIVPNQNNTPSWETSMSDWFITRMKGENTADWAYQYGLVSTNAFDHNPPVSDFVGLDYWSDVEGPQQDPFDWAWRLNRIREDVPDYARHGHPDFDGDWVRWTRTTQPGYFFRPTSNSNRR